MMRGDVIFFPWGRLTVIERESISKTTPKGGECWGHSERILVWTLLDWNSPIWSASVMPHISNAYSDHFYQCLISVHVNILVKDASSPNKQGRPWYLYSIPNCCIIICLNFFPISILTGHLFMDQQSLQWNTNEVRFGQVRLIHYAKNRLQMCMMAQWWFNHKVSKVLCWL